MKIKVGNLSAAGKIRLMNKYLRTRFRENAKELKIFKLRKLKAYVVTVVGLKKDAIEFFAKNGVYDEYLGKTEEEAFEKWYEYALKKRWEIIIPKYRQFASLEEMRLWLEIYGS